MAVTTIPASVRCTDPRNYRSICGMPAVGVIVERRRYADDISDAFLPRCGKHIGANRRREYGKDPSFRFDREAEVAAFAAQYEQSPAKVVGDWLVAAETVQREAAERRVVEAQKASAAEDVLVTAMRVAQAAPWTSDLSWENAHGYDFELMKANKTRLRLVAKVRPLLAEHSSWDHPIIEIDREGVRPPRLSLRGGSPMSLTPQAARALAGALVAMADRLDDDIDEWERVVDMS